VIDKISQLGDLTFDNVKEPITIRYKLTRHMLTYQKNKEPVEYYQRFVESGRNIQVFNVDMDLDQGQVKAFFEQYGEIEAFSAPLKRPGTKKELYHYNILYKDIDSCNEALQYAETDEKYYEPRLAADGNSISVKKYENQKEVTSSKRRT